MAKIVAVPILPKKTLFDRGKRIKSQLKRYMVNDAARTIQNDMEDTVENWRRKPSFVIEESESRGNIYVKIFPKGPHTLKWQRISGGTGPRVIKAKNPSGKMVFQRNYDPKTRPGGPFGGSGRKSGPVVRASTVYHTIEPRKFSIHIVDNREDKIINDMVHIISK